MNKFFCIEEGRIPGENQVCCDGMPRDRGNGACGCPSGFRWNAFAQECQPTFSRCGYVEERNVCSNLRDILNNLAECLFGGPESKEANRGDLPYEQACCPLMEYDDEEYYSPQDIVVY